MSEHSKSEWKLLFPVAAMILFPVIRHFMGFGPIDSAFLIVAVPLLVFPAILILGQMYKGEDWWKNQLKEGGIVALAGLAITLSLTVWLIIEFLVNHAALSQYADAEGTFSQGVIFDWIQFEIFDGASLIGTSTLSFGLDFAHCFALVASECPLDCMLFCRFTVRLPW